MQLTSCWTKALIQTLSHSYFPDDMHLWVWLRNLNHLFLVISPLFRGMMNCQWQYARLLWGHCLDLSFATVKMILGTENHYFSLLYGLSALPFQIRPSASLYEFLPSHTSPSLSNPWSSSDGCHLGQIHTSHSTEMLSVVNQEETGLSTYLGV